MFRKMLETSDDFVPLVLRVTLGLVMLPHGAQKLLGWFGGPGFDGTLGGLQEYFGVPVLLGVLVIVAESFGALGLLAGFLTRLSALGVAAVMVGAVALVHGQHGFFMNWSGSQTGEGFEYHVLALGLAVALVLRGAGAWSVDRRLSAELAR